MLAFDLMKTFQLYADILPSSKIIFQKILLASKQMEHIFEYHFVSIFMFHECPIYVKKIKEKEDQKWSISFW